MAAAWLSHATKINKKKTDGGVESQAPRDEKSRSRGEMRIAWTVIQSRVSRGVIGMLRCDDICPSPMLRIPSSRRAGRAVKCLSLIFQSSFRGLLFAALDGGGAEGPDRWAKATTQESATAPRPPRQPGVLQGLPGHRWAAPVGFGPKHPVTEWNLPSRQRCPVLHCPLDSSRPNPGPFPIHPTSVQDYLGPWPCSAQRITASRRLSTSANVSLLRQHGNRRPRLRLQLSRPSLAIRLSGAVPVPAPGAACFRCCLGWLVVGRPRCSCAAAVLS